MGQKVNPHGLRVGVIKDWNSKWYAEKDFAANLAEDYKIREFLKKRLYSAGISKIEIERASDRVKVAIYTAKPGLVIGKGGAEIEKIKAELTKKIGRKVLVDIKDLFPVVSAALIWPARRPTVKAPFRFRHFAQTSTMDSQKLIHSTAKSA